MCTRSVTTILIFFASFVHAQEQPLAWTDLPHRIAQVHGRDWHALMPEELAADLATKLAPEAGAVKSTKECGDTAFFNNSGTEHSYSVTAEFERFYFKSKCALRLTHLSVATVLPMENAEPLRGRVVHELKAGGRPAGEFPATEYTWRSTDSRTGYRLYTSVKPLTDSPQPTSRAQVRIILVHETVNPSDVDDLPFEKGFFPPLCLDKMQKR